MSRSRSHTKTPEPLKNNFMLPNTPPIIKSSVIKLIEPYINNNNYNIPIPIHRSLPTNIVDPPNTPPIIKSSTRNRIHSHISNSNNPIFISIPHSPNLSPKTAFLRELDDQQQNSTQNNKSELFYRVYDGKKIRTMTEQIFNPHHLTPTATRRRKKREGRGYQSLGGRKIRRTRRRKRKN